MQHLASGRYREAEAVFMNLLKNLPEGSTEERAITLGQLGSCHSAQGRPDRAAECYRSSVALYDKLGDKDEPARHKAVVLSELGNMLRLTGDMDGSRTSYESSLEVFRRLNDSRNIASLAGRLGAIALYGGDLEESEKRYTEARDHSKALKETEHEALASHQLGLVCQIGRRWDEAERHYAEAARIREASGKIVGANSASVTWNQLAQVADHAGKPGEAEDWFRKVLEARQDVDAAGACMTLCNLARLLLKQPDRLDEADALAESALAEAEKLEPGKVGIWEIHDTLADIANARGLAEDFRKHRMLARQTNAVFPETRNAVRQYMPLIAAVVSFRHGHKDAAAVVAHEQAAMRETGMEWTRLADAIDRIMAGEESQGIFNSLYAFQANIVATILLGIENPDNLQALIDGDAAEVKGGSSESGAVPGVDEVSRELVDMIRRTLAQPELRAAFEHMLVEMGNHGGKDFADVLRRVMKGERDADALCRGLDDKDAAVL
ncbi:MAG: tetratricopeptide repeat protein, partial [Nitrospirae bacterium]|nr:tetratricopeptide repeat protein [Nitrospirota bacterium]